MSEVLEYLLQSYKCAALRHIDATRCKPSVKSTTTDVVSHPMYSELITCSKMHAKVSPSFCGTHDCCQHCKRKYSNGEPQKIVKKRFNGRVNF